MRNLTNTSHYSNKDYNTGVIQITFWTWPYLKSISAKDFRLYKINKKRAKEFCRFLQNTAHQCLISNIFLWTNGILYKTNPHYEKYSKTLPLFHIEKGGLWKMYSSEQNSEVSEFPILTRVQSRVQSRFYTMPCQRPHLILIMALIIHVVTNFNGISERK